MDLLFVGKIFVSLFSTIALAILFSKLQGKRFKLPPGPITFPIFGSWLQIGNNLDHHILTHYAKKFGDIILIRMGQLNVVTVSSKELAKEVLLTQGIEFGSRSRNIVFDIFTGKGQDMIFTEYGDHWRKMRRIVTVPFFTNKVVQQYRGDWEVEAALLVEDVRNNPKASTTGILLRERIQLMVYNNIYKIMFDMRFESEEDPLFLKVKETNGERSRLGQNIKYNFGDFIPLLRPFLNGYLKLCKELTKRRLSLYMDSFVAVRKKVMSQEVIKESSKGQRCAIDHFLEAQKKGEIDDHNVLYIIENMNIAAIETTVWALEWAVAELTNHPSVQTKIRAEIHALLGPGVQVTESDTQKLPYLQAVIKETLRLHTIVPCLLPHMNLNDAKLGGYDIPTHSRVLVNAWRLANDPANWKEPEKFRPERFLQEESNVETNGNDMKYIPFGVGRRSCPGILIAMPVLGITLGRLVQNFELLLPPGVMKIDTRENNGQFAMRILKHSTIVLKPINN